MVSTILEKTRKLNKVLQKKGDAPVSYEELTKLLSETLNSNVYVVGASGEVMGSSFVAEEDSAIIYDDDSENARMPEGYGEVLLTIEDSLSNLTGKAILKYFKGEKSSSHKFITILPIFGNSKRLGSIILARANTKFDDEDLTLSEIAATVVGMEIIRDHAQIREIDERKSAVVEMAISTLSYSEIEAVQKIFEELEGEEGLVVASRIADKAGITRSVIVNALRKFESAGVIHSRSLGMKGTRIKILNDKLKEKLAEIK